jgi:hypothetical protein
MKYTHNILGLILLFVVGCGTSYDNPVDRLKDQLKDVPTFSIILEDMKQDGNIFTHYFHKYKIVQLDNAWVTNWEEVSEQYFKQNENFLGMTLASKKDGQQNNHVAPPGYAFVGDNNYGQWRQDANGSSFWEFYGKYRMFTDVLGFFTGPVYRHDYDDYHRYRRDSRPFFGRSHQYGTKGTYTKKLNPTFYERRMTRENKKKSSFLGRVSNRFGNKKRIGRTRSGFRSRSMGFGK